MIFPPDRIGSLIQRLEAGQPVTSIDLARVAALQTLDLASLDQQFARDMIARDDELSARLAGIA